MLTQPTPASIPADLVPDSRIATYDVVIVGGGIVGLTVACGLRGSGLKVAVLESSPRGSAARRSQAYAFSLTSARIFRGLGLWDQVRPQIEPFHHIRLSDCDWPDVVTFEPADAGEEKDLGYVAEHMVLMEALQGAVEAAPDVHWIGPAIAQNVTYKEDWAYIAVKPGNDIVEVPSQVRAKLVIGADGSRSPLRTGADITTNGWKYWQSCIVTVVRPEKHHNNTAFERFQTSGPFAILPLRNTCRVVWTAPHEEAEAMMKLEDQEFLQELSQRFGDQLGSLELVSDRRLFPVQLMQSKRYVAPRLALVGEAAHNCHPVGGQGLNLGIRDGAALAEVLVAACQRGDDLGAVETLRPYDRQRRWGNLLILGFTDILDRVFSNQWLPVMAVRRLGLFAMQRVAPIKQIAIRVMTGKWGRVPQLVPPEANSET
ncbi:MAG: FAD-dependent hydroxylase [Cyanobacteria bacterium P01_C01_bin.89]